MIIAFYIAAAFVMAGGSIYFAWRNRDFRKFLAGAFFVCRPPLYFISIYPMFRCLFWGQIFLRPQRSAPHARSSIHPLLALFLFWLCLEAKGLK